MGRSKPAVIFDEPSEQIDASAQALARSERGRWWFYLIGLSPILLPLFLIARYGVNLIWNDEWDMAEILLSAHRGTLTWSQLWKLHNEHRMPVPYGLMYLLAKCTNWNLRAEMFVGAMIALLAGVFLGSLIRSTNLPDETHRLDDRQRVIPLWVWQWLAITLLAFSAVQYENWIYGFGAMQNFLPMTCITAAMALLYRRGVKWTTVIAAGLLIETATLSLANGMLGWFLILPLLFVVESWDALRERRLLIIAWLVMMSIGIGTYFVGYEKNPLAKNYYNAGFGVRLQYFFAFLGQPLTYGVIAPVVMAQIVGFIILCLYIACVVYLVRRSLRGQMELVRRMLPWICLGAYSIGSGAMGASGRAGLGVSQASNSRYTSISIYMIICLVRTIPMILRDLERRDRVEPIVRRSSLILSSLGTALTLGLLLSTVWSFAASHEWMREKEMGQAHLAFIRFIDEPNRLALVCDRKDLREAAIAVNALGYLHPPLIDSDDLRGLTAKESDSQSSKYGEIEGVQQLPNGTANLWGWASLPNPPRPADAVIVAYLSSDGASHACGIADVMGARADIAKKYGADLLSTGWTMIFPLTRLPAGQHNIQCYAYDAERQQAYQLPFAVASPATTQPAQ